MMARYSLNLPVQLKKEAEDIASEQGVSLNQFIMWAVAEKVGELRQGLDDPEFPQVTYRQGASGVPMPIIKGTGIRVQTLITAIEQWEMTIDQVADEYGLTKLQVEEAVKFYKKYGEVITVNIAAERNIEAEYGK